MSRFTIRVYGLIIQNDAILLVDEHRFGKRYTKFPGGGLEFGEGTIDCLKREFQEELGVEIDSIAHFYTTDFCQISAFHEATQVISIYYTAQLASIPNVSIAELPFEHIDLKNGIDHSFRWCKLHDLKEDTVTWPIDKKVVELLKS